MAEAKTTTNYTEEMVERMVARYEELGNEGLETIAEELGRSVRSVRSKLVTLGAYQKAEAPKATPKREGPTKKELLNELEALVDFDVDGLMGATKAAIAALITYAQSVETSAVAEESEEV